VALRDDDAIAWAMSTGCRRVNIGTAALENPDWCAAMIKTWGDRVAVGLDVRGRRLAARGWTSEGGDLLETLARLDAAGCERYVVTDVAKDGMLAGPNLDLLQLVCDHTDAPVIASGGVTTVEDLGRHRRPRRRRGRRCDRRNGPVLRQPPHRGCARRRPRQIG